MFSSIMRILQITSLEQPPLYSYIPLSWMDNFNELSGMDLCFSLHINGLTSFSSPYHPLLKKISPLLLVVKNRPSDNQISSYDFLKMHNFGIQPGLPITFPEKIPLRLMVKNSPLIAKINAKTFQATLNTLIICPLKISAEKNTPSLLVQFQPPFDNLKNSFSLKVHI